MLVDVIINLVMRLILSWRRRASCPFGRTSKGVQWGVKSSTNGWHGYLHLHDTAISLVMLMLLSPDEGFVEYVHFTGVESVWLGGELDEWSFVSDWVAAVSSSWYGSHFLERGGHCLWRRDDVVNYALQLVSIISFLGFGEKRAAL